MKGRLDADDTPLLEFEISEAGQAHEVVIDTGFNDYLYLPENLVTAWALPFVMSGSVELADGSVIIADLYEAHLNWLGRAVRVSVLAGPPAGDSLLGMKLLAGCRIELDEQTREVRVESL
ncbi:MAG TPA: hypothetical protein VNQ79_07450 [Blastocatellia bacterium]|nr:hypothetical protein [Blastocatellia bacterium]